MKLYLLISDSKLIFRSFHLFLDRIFLFESQGLLFSFFDFELTFVF